SFFAFGASADFSDADTIEYTDEVSILTGLGIIAGFEDGSFQPAGDVTRAQMAKLIAYAILGADDAEELSKSAAFTDVPADHWAAGYILFCKNLGIIDGYGDGTFGPNDNVTGYQIAKMLLCAIGYGQNDEYTGTNWTANVSKKAISLDLFDGNVGGLNNVPATREQACLYLWNGLNIQTVTYDGDDGYKGINYNTGEEDEDGDDIYADQTLAHKNYKLTTVTGQVTANGATDADYQADEDDDVDAQTELDGDEDYGIGSDLDLFGHIVTIYYKEGHPETAYAITDESKISAAVTISQSDSTDDETCDALKDAGFKVSSSADDSDITVFVSDNYAAFETGEDEELTLDELNNKTTYIFISDDSDKEPVYAIQINEQLYKVTKLNDTTEVVTLKTATGGTSTVDYDDVTSGLDTIAKDDYVVGVEVNGEFMSFKVAETVTGTVSSINVSKSKITLDGTVYKSSSATLGTSSINEDAIKLTTIDKDYIDDEISTTLYLDSAGNYMMIVQNDEATNDSIVAAYDSVDKLASDEDNTLVTNSYVKAYTLDGTAVTYMTAEDVDDSDEDYGERYNGYNGGPALYTVSVDSDGIAEFKAIATTGTGSSGTTYYGAEIDAAEAVEFESTDTSINVDTIGTGTSEADKAYVNSSTVYIFIYEDDDDIVAKVVTGGINYDLPTDTTLVATKSGSNYIAKAVLITDDYYDNGVAADSILYFENDGQDGYNGYYLYTGYDCGTGEKETYAIKKVDGTSITSIDEGEYAGMPTTDGSTVLVLDGFFSYTVADGVYTLTSEPEDEADENDYIYDTEYVSYFGDLLTTDDTIDDFDFSDAVVVDVRDDDHMDDDAGYYKSALTSVSDIDSADDSGYTVTLSVLVDYDEGDVLAIFVTNAEDPDFDPEA
ncbi:MAG: S-layer homology domain-containing protein, partial [Oscillospiraceae bacterium]